MGDNSAIHFELNDPNPSIYRLWQKARAEGGTAGEIEDRYRELLEEFGHRDVNAGRWT